MSQENEASGKNEIAEQAFVDQQLKTYEPPI